MVSTSDQQLATEESCRAWLQGAVFNFRPKEYCEKYPDWPGRVGLEIEMGAFMQASLQQQKPRMLPLKGHKSLSSILRDLAKEKNWHAEMVEDDFLFKVRLDENDQLTFEPGAQLEFSSKPYPCLSDAYDRMEVIQSILDKAFAAHEARLLQFGYNPWLSVNDIGLQMDKPRYRAMDSFFTAISPFGRQMMRQTCTIQINLDLGDNEETLATRYLLANLIAPLCTGIFANSPISEGRINGFRSYRGRIWLGLDNSRTGFPKTEALKKISQSLSKESCVDAYWESIANAKVIFVEALGFKNPPRPITFREWLKTPIEGVSPTLGDFKTHLSLHFPEVRPRGFLELRSVDCQARVWQRVPGAFYSALLYDPGTTAKAVEMMLPYVDKLPQLLEKSYQGLQDDFLASLAQKAMLLVLDGFEKLPACFRGDKTGKALHAFASHFTAKRRTPADDYLMHLKSSGQDQLSPQGFMSVVEGWEKLVT